jgi:hypothetical protein
MLFVPSGFSREGAEPIPGVGRRQLRRSLQTNRALSVRRALERRIVVNDDDAVAGEMDVELETVGAEGEPVIERGQRVLRPQRRAAAMGVDQGARQNRWSQKAILPSNPKLQTPRSKALPTLNCQTNPQAKSQRLRVEFWCGCLGSWRLGVPWSLGFGAWDLSTVH